MSLDSIPQFLSAIDRAGELARISEPVRARLEICEIADRVMKQPGGGKALYFENVILDNGERSHYPVVINLFGSMRRICLALGVDDLDEIGGRITEMLDLKVPEGLIGKLAMLPRLLEIGKFPPRVKGGKPPSQEIILKGDEVDLSTLPIITCWPEDGGPYITLPMVISKDPKRGIRNVGMYRVQVLGPRSLAMHWQRHKVGAAHWREMAEKGEKMSVVIAIGADPASVYSASAPLPPTRRSAPPPPVIVSLPSKPTIMSLPDVPVSVSPPFVPRITPGVARPCTARSAAISENPPPITTVRTSPWRAPMVVSATAAAVATSAVTPTP